MRYNCLGSLVARTRPCRGRGPGPIPGRGASEKIYIKLILFRIMEDDMYNPVALEMREYTARLRGRVRNLTPEEARRDLVKAGLIDEEGMPTDYYLRCDS